MKIINVLLFITASLLKWLLTPIGYLYGLVRSWNENEWGTYHLDLAIAKDQYGNALCKYLFNDLLIKWNGYKFGNIDETISSVIGKNKVANTLTPLGLLIDRILNKFEKDHSINSIDNTENELH